MSRSAVALLLFLIGSAVVLAPYYASETRWSLVGLPVAITGLTWLFYERQRQRGASRAGSTATTGVALLLGVVVGVLALAILLVLAVSQLAS